MPFIFLIAGVVMLVAGVRARSSELLGLIKGDVTGDGNFEYWILSILVIGAIGYVDDLKSLSRAFMVLILVVLILADNKKGGGGLFAKFTEQFSQVTGKVATQ